MKKKNPGNDVEATLNTEASFLKYNMFYASGWVRICNRISLTNKLLSVNN